MLNYILQFILGGGIIVGMTLLAEHHGGKTAALLYAVPLQFTISAVAIYLGTSTKTVQDLSVGCIYGLLILAAFVGVFYILSHVTGFWFALAGSYLVFILCGCSYLRYVAFT